MLTDDQLVSAAQAGDRDAFAQLLDRYLTPVRTFLALKAPVPQLVDELTHETFVFAYRHLGEFTAGTSLRAWLRAIAGNLLRAEVQRFAREQANQSRYLDQRLVELTESRPETQVSLAADRLEDCLQKVPGPLRELLALKYREDLPSDEIAMRLEKSAAWVRTTLFRLREQLRDCIERTPA